MLLRQMKYFLAAVYCKSFNEAAKQCFISQPSFSLQIKQLEKELGVKLINRNNCNFSLGRLQVQIEQDLSSNYISGIHLIKKSVEQFIRSVVA